MRMLAVEKVKDRRAFDDPRLKLSVRRYVRRYEGRRADSQHILREAFVVHQLWPRHAHHLDANANEANVVDIGWTVRSRTREAHPSGKGLPFRENSVLKIRGDVVANEHFAAQNSVSLCIAGPLIRSGLVMRSHV